MKAAEQVEQAEQQGPASAPEAGNTAGSNTAQVLYLSVDEIRLSEITNVRPFSSKQDGEKELVDIQRLMTSIEQEGQIEPVVVMKRNDAKPGEPVWDLVAGRRRVKAITMHNMASDIPLKVKAVVGDAVKQASQLFRRAAHENLMREQITAIDFAHNIRTVREKMKWKSAKDTKKVAEFFVCSEAQVTQHEKLLGLDEVFQQAIADGKLTRDGAYALLKVKADQRQGVYDAALEKQKLELNESGAEETKSASTASAATAATAATTAATAATSTAAPKPKTGNVSGAAKSGGVKAKHVKTAAREADPAVRQSRSKKDIVEYFEAMMGPVYGYETGAVWQFCSNFIKWVKGEIAQDRTLDKYWNAMVEKAPRGTPPPPVAKGAVKDPGSLKKAVKATVKANKAAAKKK